LKNDQIAIRAFNHAGIGSGVPFANLPNTTPIADQIHPVNHTHPLSGIRAFWA
jgi:hypothetical protein